MTLKFKRKEKIKMAAKKKASAPSAGRAGRAERAGSLSVSEGGALRYNKGKLRPGLVSPWATEGIAAVLTDACTGPNGEEGKYPPRNWEKGLPAEQLIDSLERHLIALKKGEIFDACTGLPHIDHIATNAMFYSHFHHTGELT